MADEKVKIRIKIADYELEVQGRKKWAEKTVKEFIERIKKQQGSK